MALAVASWLSCDSALAQSSPADLYGELFRRVQEERIFPDGKTFVDAQPQHAPAAIMTAYSKEHPATKDALRRFVLENFAVPGVNDHQAGDLRNHVRALWPTLVRPPVEARAGGSALAMPA
ncbi:MAG: trehalase, partial [Sphingobium sp.]